MTAIGRGTESFVDPDTPFGKRRRISELFEDPRVRLVNQIGSVLRAEASEELRHTGGGGG